MKDLCQKWKVKLIFQGVWNSLMAWPDWPLIPIILRQIYAGSFCQVETVVHTYGGKKQVNYLYQIS